MAFGKTATKAAPKTQASKTAVNAGLLAQAEEFVSKIDGALPNQIFNLDLSGNGVASIFEIDKVYTVTLNLGDTENSLVWSVIKAQSDGREWEIPRARAVITYEGARYALPVEGVQMLAFCSIYSETGDVPTCYMKVTERTTKAGNPLKVVHFYGSEECNPKDDYITFDKLPDGKPDFDTVIGW